MEKKTLVDLKLKTTADYIRHREKCKNDFEEFIKNRQKEKTVK